MCYYVLKQNGRIIARSTVRPITKEEWSNVTEQNMRLNFDKEIAEIYSAFDETLIHHAPNEAMKEPFHPQDMENHAVPLNPTDNTGEVVSGPHELKDAEIYLPRGDRNEIAKVLGRKRNPEGLYIGRKHSNPRLDYRTLVRENIVSNFRCLFQSFLCDYF